MFTNLDFLLGWDIERSPLFLVFQTPSKSFQALLITIGGVRGYVGSEKHA